jgi:hypothetical protein
MNSRILLVLSVAVAVASAGVLYGAAQHQPSEWAKEAWGWAKSEGITDGTNPQGACTREMVMVWLYRLEQRRSQGWLTPPKAAYASGAWQMVNQFMGNATRSTTAFTVGPEWKIAWRTEPGDSGGTGFQIHIYDVDGNLAGVAADVNGASISESYQHQAGTYHLLISTAQSYRVEVWEKR